MAIDKTIPNRLQTDLDQRLVRPEIGEMTDAQNVMLSEEGVSSSGVIKNMLGTTAATRPALSPIADGEDVVVIGSVSDTQRGFVYWFVADRNEDGVENAIYRQNTGDNSYELVLKNPSLNFEPDGFVKADIVNAAFQQDGVIQTALYFTDNINPPRKINVDRALSSTVYDATADDFDTVISTCKPAMQRYPEVSFSSDSDFPQNNFRDTAFQFAVQLIYTDGEESAISAYSEVAITRPEILSVQESSGFGLSPFIDNTCEIVIPLDFQIPDLKKVRILARDNVSGLFFVVDEFDPDQDLYRDFFNSNKQIYDASQRRYRFYNNSLGVSVSQTEVNKLYDNVPFVSGGQSVSGNRLMFSNYEEGRPNNITNASLSVQYLSDSGSGSGELLVKGVDLIIDDAPSGLGVDIDILATSAFNSVSDPVPQGSFMELSFDFGVDFRLDLDVPDANKPIRVDIIEGGSTSYWVPKFNNFPSSDPDIKFKRKIENSRSRVSARRVVDGASESIGFAFNQLKDQFNDITLRYHAYNDERTVGGVDLELVRLEEAGSNNQVAKFLSTKSTPYYFDVTWGFDGYVDNSTEITIKPYIKSIDASNVRITDFENTGVSGVEIGDNGEILYSELYGSSAANLKQSIITPKTFDTDIVTFQGFISGKYATVRTTPFNKTFKAGSSHTFGVVYYDEFNRSGNVNKIGTAYVEPIQSSNRTNRGAATITVDFNDTVPPLWATSYQIVYSGSDSYSDYLQYTTSSAFFKHDESQNHEPDHNIENVYVSLKTLDIYNDHKNSSRNYSFTKGDKLRVIGNYDGTNRTYVNDNNGDVIEFNVLGTTTLDESFAYSYNQSNYTPVSSTHTEFGGTILILEAPQVSGGVAQFDGYDWFEITGTNRSDVTDYHHNNTDNKWGNGTVVEIVSPKKYSEDRAYYEIGHGKSITNGDHGTPIVLENGDSYFRPIACKTSPDEATTGTVGDYIYRTFYLESNTISDGFSSRYWHKGRPHVVFENSATVRRYNGITYSDAYAEDVSNLSLSSFNGSLANFFSLESANGACNYIGTLNDQFLVAIQENKMSVVPVNKNILQQSQGGNLAALSTKVLNDPRYYIGDYGCGNNPESVLIRDGQVFFVDASRSAVCRFTTEGISAISDKGVSSLFRDELADFTAQGGTRIVSGYDPRYDHYYVTLRPTGTFNGLTLGYARGIAQGGAWQSRYTFFPDMYSNQNDMMYSAVYRNPEGDDNATIFYSHDNAVRNSFYGDDAAPSIVQVVSNNNPSMTKVFNAVSLEGDSANWVADPIVTDLNSSAQSLEFIEKEGSYYSFITRDENGTKHITGVGRVASLGSGADTITFDNRVNRNPIPYGSAIRLISGTAYENIGSLNSEVTFVRFVDAYTIEVAGTINLLLGGLVGGDLVAVSESTINGDPVRGHWAEITLTNNQTTAFELFCVNTHIANSKQNHASGQQ